MAYNEMVTWVLGIFLFAVVVDAAHSFYREWVEDRKRVKFHDENLRLKYRVREEIKANGEKNFYTEKYYAGIDSGGWSSSPFPYDTYEEAIKNIEYWKKQEADNVIIETKIHNV